MTSTTSDLALLGRKLGAKDYEPEVYVKEITHHCVGGHELHQQRSNIQVSIKIASCSKGLSLKFVDLYAKPYTRSSLIKVIF